MQIGDVIRFGSCQFQVKEMGMPNGLIKKVENSKISISNHPYYNQNFKENEKD